MKWRVMVELTRQRRCRSGRRRSARAWQQCRVGMLSSRNGRHDARGRKTELAGLQDHLVRAQADEYCRQRQGCSHCGSQRPLKDVRTRRLLSLFGTVEVRAPRFLPCHCAVTSRHTLTPCRPKPCPIGCTPSTSVSSRRWGLYCHAPGPGRCCPEFLPHRRRSGRGDRPAAGPCEWALRLEQQAASSQPAAPAAEAP